MERNMEPLKKGLAGWNIELTDKQIDQFLLYYKQIIEKNKVMNLTTITDFHEVIEKHFLDSLAFVLIPAFYGEGSLIDVGSGAGFPGIPLKIVFPSLHVVLLDSLNKRVEFLNYVIETLGLKGIYAIHGRAEDIGRKPEYREKFDFCVSRAVAHLSILTEYAMPFVKQGGYFISYKAGKIENELMESKHAVEVLSGTIENKISFTIPNTDMERTLIQIQKTAPISKKYPRKAGTPQREPLIQK